VLGGALHSVATAWRASWVSLAPCSLPLSTKERRRQLAPCELAVLSDFLMGWGAGSSSGAKTLAGQRRSDKHASCRTEAGLRGHIELASVAPTWPAGAIASD
jgi:hypothetical protein